MAQGPLSRMGEGKGEGDCMGLHPPLFLRSSSAATPIDLAVAQLRKSEGSNPPHPDPLPSGRGKLIAWRRLTVAILALLLAACGDDGDTAGGDPCALTPRAHDAADLAASGDAACFGDTVLARLAPDGAERTAEFDIEIPRSGRVRLCVDLVDDHPHALELFDAGGVRRAQVVQGSGCADIDIVAGRHTLRLTNGRPHAANAYGYLAFIHPMTSTELQAEGTGLLGAYSVTSACPNCDLRGANLAGTTWLCSNTAGGDCEDPNPAHFFCLVATTKNSNPQFIYSNDFSGTRFGGANLNGSFFECVSLRGAQFWDDQYGAASLQTGPTCCHEGFPVGAPKFEACDMRGASLRNLDLRVADFTCSVVGDAPSVFDPANLSGADLRGANMGNVDYSIRRCDYDSDPNNPYGNGRLNLSGAIVDSTTNLKGTDLSGADLSGWDWHLTDWSQTIMRLAVLADGDMSGFNFTAAPYVGKFFIADKNTDYFGGADMTGMNFTGANFSGQDLQHAVMPAADLTSALLTGVNLSGADFTGATLVRTDLESVIASESVPATFNKATMTYAFLKNAQLAGSFFRGAVMNPANLLNADLAGAWLEDQNSQFGRTVLTGSHMLNTKLNGAHMTDAVLDNVSWYNVNPASPIATGAGALLTGASFNLADLPGLDLTGAFLQGVSMTNTQLIGANLTGAHIGRDGTVSANLSTANLRGANLTSTDLSYANLQNAGVDPAAEAEVYIEVLKDPDRYEKPEEYEYFAVNRPATVLGAGGTVSVVTDHATCPSGAGGPCGAITSPAWVAPVGPQEPTDCMPTQYDNEGNVIAITCSSSRHPTGG